MTLNEKCEFLESIGFTVNHGLSDVEHSGFRFDFSATRIDAENIIGAVIGKVYKEGQDLGKKELQIQLQSLLGV